MLLLCELLLMWSIQLLLFSSTMFLMSSVTVRPRFLPPLLKSTSAHCTQCFYPPIVASCSGHRCHAVAEEIDVSCQMSLNFHAVSLLFDTIRSQDRTNAKALLLVGCLATSLALLHRAFLQVQTPEKTLWFSRSGLERT